MFHDVLWHVAFLWVTGITLLTLLGVPIATADSGCAISAADAGFPDTRIAACRGKWVGHVKYASTLCAPGWSVCSWDADRRTLSKMAWNVALSVDGCFAYNAAQDGGRCQECMAKMDQDDLAGIGRGCPQQRAGEGSCVSGGRIDASCCVDAHESINWACQQQAWINGVMCCKQSAKRPHIIVPPPANLDVNVGRIFMLSCQAEGIPVPRVQWYKDGSKIPELANSRVSVLLSGDLLVTLARRSDSGHYSCEVINEEGIDIGHTQVNVKDHDSGCADDTTDGLLMHRDIHACEGNWTGHVKKGGALCKQGWHVCNSKDRDRLHDLSWLDILDINGCYAYNVANNRRGKCKRCDGRGRLAGVGRDCGRVRYSRLSCLAQGRIDVFKTRDLNEANGGCSYVKGFTTGILCCKGENKQTKQDRRKNEITSPDKPHCTMGCENGGQCVGYNVCMCPVGYKGAMCQNAVCHDGCPRHSKCVRPGECECIQPYEGPNCSHKQQHKHTCKSPCLNGGRCRGGKCKCPSTHYGSSCQHLWKHVFLSQMNRTER
ncbi:uncharacterized protein LOC127842965 [Dreissena polymorpha]|uniref:Uncharacterized protein n=1 Tax=Dreissena polymorpha TaxID=45954 RepID=A0A9D4EYZ1_DREPO|nr:uncharacterized protein LOC127842965 [Dreissena polymorpha]XP_052228732.1 uncharacterized protein LOC127842965 [Dreissena polymorpha]KAH3788483.1 hypothetical protein DPMN_166627 [Dreissena polymorpha]